MPRLLRFLALGTALTASPATAEFLVAVGTDSLVAARTSDGGIESSWVVPLEIDDGVRAIDWVGGAYLLGDLDGDVWTTDGAFGGATVRFSLPSGGCEGMAIHAGVLYVNTQVSVPPDSLLALDPSTGAVLDRFAVPDSITSLKDLTSDGTHLWGIEASPRRLWRIDPASGAFELAHDLANPFVFALAWCASASKLWILENDAGRQLVVARAVDRSSGEITESVTVQRSSFAFLFAATARGQLPEPVIPISWGRVKGRFLPVPE